MSELSPTTKALLRSARQDAPGGAARSKIWSGVAVKAAGGTALGAAAGKAVASAATAKLFVMGALLGSAVTVGVAALMLHIGAPTLRSDPSDMVHADSESSTVAHAARGEALVRPSLSEESETPAPAATPAKHASAHARVAPDTLGREAELVAEARGAVVRGEPDAALSAIHAAQALRAHALAPEELSLEVRALRALGRDDEANDAEDRLRTQYPDHALAR